MYLWGRGEQVERGLQRLIDNIHYVFKKEVFGKVRVDVAVSQLWFNIIDQRFFCKKLLSNVDQW